MMIQRFKSVRLTLIAAVLMMWSGLAPGGITTITLRSTVRVSSDAPVTLRQIGVIRGDQSRLLADLGIEELLSGESGQWQQLAVSDLRDLIEREPGVHAGSVLIEGAGVSIRKLGAAGSSATLSTRSKQGDKPVQDTVVTGPVVRNHVERWVRDRYQIGDDLMRLSFRENDNSFLSTPTSSRLVEIKEISKRGRTAIRVIVLDNLEVAAEQALVFDVEIFRTVLVARERVSRGTVLGSSHIMTERRWVTPEDQSAGIESALGMALSKTVNPGQLIQVQHIELPLVIRRGDIVSSKSISGSVVVTVRGRATADARLGEVVEIESMNGENQFSAKATGKGKAVILRSRTNGGVS